MQEYNYYGSIYLLRNKINGRCYVGQTTMKVEHRWKYYKAIKCKNQTKLYNALKKYGWDSFETMVLCYAENQSELNEKEIHCAKIFDCHVNGYNIKECGSKGKMSLESRQKLSIKIKALTSGVKKSEKHKLGMSVARLGKPISEAAKKKISDKLKGRISNRKGAVLSEETKLKISKNKMGKKINVNRINCIGHKHTEETKLKISNMKKGIAVRFGPHTDTTKNKIKEAIKIHWEKRRSQLN